MLIFGERLREARKRKNLTAKDAAEKAGTTEKYLYEVEKGRKTPSLELVTKLTRVYGDLCLINEFMRIKEIDNITPELRELRNEVVHQKVEMILKDKPEFAESLMEFLEKYQTMETKEKESSAKNEK